MCNHHGWQKITCIHIYIIYVYILWLEQNVQIVSNRSSMTLSASKVFAGWWHSEHGEWCNVSTRCPSKQHSLEALSFFVSKHGRHIQSHLGMPATHGCTYELTINAEMLSARMKEASFFKLSACVRTWDLCSIDARHGHLHACRVKMTQSRAKAIQQQTWTDATPWCQRPPFRKGCYTVY